MGFVQPDSPLPEPNPATSEYARQFDVSMEEAQRRLDLQFEMTELASRIAEQEPTFGGSWLQHKPELRLFVAFASPDGEKIISPYLDGINWATSVEVRVAAHTIKDLQDVQERIIQFVPQTDIPFESGIDYETGKINLYTPHLEELQSKVQLDETIKGYSDSIEYIYQERMSEPAVLKYPYLLGSSALTSCTAGFVVVRPDNNRRAMLTAGHCENIQYTTDGIYFGLTGNENGWLENDPYPDPLVGPFGEDMDIQVHDASVRSLDLTNEIYTSVGSTAKVISSRTKADTRWVWVCKNGKSTGATCGQITDIAYAPTYAPVPRYVRVDSSAYNDIACGGDSGSPVFQSLSGGVAAFGILSGVLDKNCNGGNTYFFYTPIDEINCAGYSILTTHYKQYFVQNVWWTETSCTEYKQELDSNGNSIGAATSQPCLTGLPAGSSGTIESYTAYELGNYWREAIWRGGAGYMRDVPLNGNGAINWGAAPAWSYCCTGTAPRAQGAYILGNHFYQNVWWTETNCIEYKRVLDNFGNPGSQTSQACGTSAPGSGTIQSYDAYPVHGKLREAMWRNNVGYMRDVPLNATNTNVDWASAPAWQQCCTGNPPRAQGGDILTQP